MYAVRIPLIQLYVQFYVPLEDNGTNFANFVCTSQQSRARVATHLISVFARKCITNSTFRRLKIILANLYFFKFQDKRAEVLTELDEK